MTAPHWQPVDLEAAYEQHLAEVLVFMISADVTLSELDPSDDSRWMPVDGERWIDNESIADLWRGGFVRQIGSWTYTLTDAGRARAKALAENKECYHAD